MPEDRLDIKKEAAFLDAFAHQDIIFDSETLRMTFEYASVGLCATSLDGYFLMANQKFCDMLGYTTSELSVMKFWNLTHPDDVERCSEGARALQEGLTDKFAMEKRYISKNGDLIWADLTTIILRDARTDQRYFLTAAYDISSKKAAEEELLRSRRQLAEIIDFLPDATLAIDRDRKVIIWNRAIEKMTGVPAAEMIGKGDYAYTVPFYGEKRRQLMDLIFDFDGDIADRYSNFRREGDTIMAEIYSPALYDGQGAWIWVKASPLHDHKNNIIGVVESIRDISELKRSEAVLKASETRLKRISNIAADILYSCVDDADGDYSIDWMSGAAMHITGYSIEEISDMRCWKHIVHEEDMDLFNTHVIGLMPGDESSCELRVRAQNGNIVWLSSFAECIEDPENIGRHILYGALVDINERKLKEEKISYLSYHDQLTGLYNRRFYEEELLRLDTERNLPITIVMGDVNGLKLINDSFGHAMGDELLEKVAKVIKNGCRADDIIARLGGDEFAVILPKSGINDAKKVVKRIKDLAVLEKVSGIDVSISFGYASKAEAKDSMDETVKNAEDAMYRNKLFESTSMRGKTIDLIMNTLYEKNNREMLHSKRVGALCENIATHMNLGKEEIEHIRLAGLMHDIGKIGIDEKILNKTDRLDDDEWKEIRRHSEIGYRILSSVNEFSEIANYVLEHQERWDGKGYPRGIAADSISLQARIIAVADAFDAMTSPRTYGAVLTEDQALRELYRCSGNQFDPEIVRIFTEDVMGL